MRQFDIVELSDKSFAIVLQADLLDLVGSRAVAPLVRDALLVAMPKLRPIIRVGRRDYHMMTDQLGAVMKVDIVRVVASARDREGEIRRALDMVFVGV